MSGKAVVSLTTGLEDPEKVTVAFLVAVAAAEQFGQADVRAGGLAHAMNISGGRRPGPCG